MVLRSLGGTAGGSGSMRSRVLAALLAVGLLAVSVPVLIPLVAWVWQALTGPPT